MLALSVFLGGVAQGAPLAVTRAAPTAVAPRSSTTADLDVFVITFGPGDHPFSKFGHDAVLVVDRDSGKTWVYNFGTFSAASPTLISDFLQGRLMYWVSVGDWRHTFAAYAAANRSVLAQKLDLDADQKARLVDSLATNALPANRYYRYDYYLDNCSTRVRDVLDDVLGGRLARAKLAPAALDWRQHTSRLTSDSFWLNLGLNLLLTGGLDTPKTRWEEMFLPSVLADELAETHLADGRPLVERQMLWHRATRPAVAASPPKRGLLLLVAGLVIAAGLALLGTRARNSRAARLGFTAVVALLSLVAGLLGCIFAFFWLFTDHYFAHANENLLVFPPWALLLTVTVLGALSGRRFWVRSVRAVSLSLAVGIALGLLLKALPQFHQDNWMFLGLMFPVWGAIAAQLRRIYPVGKRVPAVAAPGERKKLTPSPIL